MDAETSAILEKMDFFELVEDDGTIVYCYEPDENGEYLILSNDMGETPHKDQPVIVACYSPQDAFLWKAEFKNIGQLFEIYEKSGGKTAFIDAIKN